MTEKIFIRAEIQGELPSGQKVVHLLVNNADGFVFCTDEKSIVRPQEIETTVNEFWSKLQKLSIAKGKEKPTLEELLECIEQVKAEAIKEFADKLKGLMALNGRISNEDYYYMTIYIDKIVKEMVGDTE